MTQDGDLMHLFNQTAADFLVCVYSPAQIQLTVFVRSVTGRDKAVRTGGVSRVIRDKPTNRDG